MIEKYEFFKKNRQIESIKKDGAEVVSDSNRDISFQTLIKPSLVEKGGKECSDCKNNKRHSHNSSDAKYRKSKVSSSRSGSSSSSNSSSSSSSGASSHSSASSASEEDREKQKIKALKEKLAQRKILQDKIATFADLADVESIKLTRNQLLDMLNLPDGHYQEIVVGAFARVVVNST